MMTYRTMGKTGVRLSSLGFGCMRLPMKDERTVDRDKAIPMLRRAYSLGVNYFDTGKWYCGQDSEKTLGEALKGMDRSKVFVSTKYAFEKPTAADLREKFETSLAAPRSTVRRLLPSLGDLVESFRTEIDLQRRTPERLPGLKERRVSRNICPSRSTLTPRTSRSSWTPGSSRACSASTTSWIGSARRESRTPRPTALAWPSWAPLAGAGSTAPSAAIASMVPGQNVSTPELALRLRAVQPSGHGCAERNVRDGPA